MCHQGTAQTDGKYCSYATVDSFGFRTVSDVFAGTFMAKTNFHNDQMIREDKDRRVESTKQKAAFVFAVHPPAAHAPTFTP